jgi:outer membrane lipoprotein SlyB
MKLPQRVLALVLAATAVLPLAMFSGAAQSQTQTQPQTQLPARMMAQEAPRIEGFNVDEVPRLGPGIELNFEIFGTPGGVVTLRIDGAQRSLALLEAEPGRYEGTYTINSRDKIEARSPVTANLRLGNQVTSLVLNESLQAGVGYHGAKMSAASLPKIEHFNVDPAADLKGGEELYFWLLGTPGAQVDLAIQGVRGKVLLPEVKTGEYATTYTIRKRDRILPGSLVTATMHLGDRVSTADLGKPLQSPYAPEPLHVTRTCYNCGTVEAINLVEVKGEGGYVGAIGGGLVGAILGNQVGQGNGRTAAQVAGALGGAYAGRALEAQSKNSSHYEVVVRLQTGNAQAVSFATAPALKVGDKVTLNDGVIVLSPN